VLYAPVRSGVYVICARDAWVYIGKSGNVEASLLQHYNGDHLSIRHHQPTHFAFELVLAQTRAARKRELIAEFEPECD
jgi:predicted GIY-YIG superfamily endonuclease